jgi:hypothetical protein
VAHSHVGERDDNHALGVLWQLSLIRERLTTMRR